MKFLRELFIIIFRKKTDIINYFEHLNLLKIEWLVQSKQDKLNPIELIELSFDLFAETINQPYLFFEIVSIFTSEHIKPQKSTLLPAEKFYAYPEYPGIEKIKVKSIDDFFLKYIKEARKGGQIDKNVSNKDITRILKAILIGIPLAIEIEEFDDLAKIYKKQLMLSRKLFLKNTL